MSIDCAEEKKDICNPLLITSADEAQGSDRNGMSANEANLSSACTSNTLPQEGAPEEILNEQCDKNENDASSDAVSSQGGDVAAEYAYTKQERFTSEVFKIEIGHLPKYFSFGECKKLLTKKLKLKPHKVNVLQNIRKAYVTFKNKEDKLEAIEKLSNYKHKGWKLKVKNAKPKADAMAVKRPYDVDDSGDTPDTKLAKLDDSQIEEMLRNTVVPWWNKPYNQQLEDKQKIVYASLAEIRKQICAVDHLDLEIFRWLMMHKKSGLCCPTKQILPSPVTAGYRNKCGFSVGQSLRGEKSVGFRLGKYRNHMCAIEPPTCLEHVPQVMKDIVAKFTDYIKQSKLSVYDRQDHTGHWRQITVRSTRNNMNMIVIALSKQELTDDDVSKEKDAVKEYFLSNNVPMDTLLFRVVLNESISNMESVPAEPVLGEGVIYEQLFDLKCRISPDAFFQCNTLAAEILYDCVKQFVLNQIESDEQKTRKDVVLLDVCCGTGTIGLSLAKSVKHVIGVDVCQQAIDDAKSNAEINGISNAEFRQGRAEDELPSIIQQVSRSSNEVVAVVDPPRCGLHNKVIKSIRQCSLIEKLVYVSCSVDQAKSNFVDLCRPCSKRMIGLPFKPVLAQPVDLFPHTAHCETVLLFKRLTPKASAEIDQSGSSSL